MFQRCDKPRFISQTLYIDNFENRLENNQTWISFFVRYIASFNGAIHLSLSTTYSDIMHIIRIYSPLSFMTVYGGLAILDEARRFNFPLVTFLF